MTMREKGSLGNWFPGLLAFIPIDGVIFSSASVDEKCTSVVEINVLLWCARKTLAKLFVLNIVNVALHKINALHLIA